MFFQGFRCKECTKTRRDKKCVMMAKARKGIYKGKEKYLQGMKKCLQRKGKVFTRKGKVFRKERKSIYKASVARLRCKNQRWPPPLHDLSHHP